MEIMSYLILRILLQKAILQCILYSLSDDNYVQRSSDITLIDKYISYVLTYFFDNFDDSLLCCQNLTLDMLEYFNIDK